MTTSNPFGSEPNHHVLSVLVQNRPGVLARVASLFARRGYNIFSLAVAPTEQEDYSRITIVVDLESATLEQMVKQLFKLVDVVRISELDPRNSVERELMVATVRSTAEQRGQIVELVNIFEGTLDSMCFLSGDFPGGFSVTIFGRPVMDGYWDEYTVFSFLNLPQDPSFSFQTRIDTEEKCLEVVGAKKDRGAQKGFFKLS